MENSFECHSGPQGLKPALTLLYFRRGFKPRPFKAV